MLPDQSLEDDDVARRPKRKLNFSDFRFGISAVDFHVRILAVKAASISVESASIPKALGAEEPVVLRSQDTRGVVTLTLNRPQAFNALSEAMLAALRRDFDVIAKDESVFLRSARR